MDSKQIINHRQICWLIGALVTGGGPLLIQRDLFMLSRMDAWFSFTLPILYTVLMSFVLYRLNIAFPGKNFFEIAKLLTGKVIGSIINLLIVIHLTLVMMRDLRSLAQFISFLLPSTPKEILILLFIMVMMYFGTTSIEVIARVNDIFYPIFLAIIVLLPILLANEIDIGLLLPTLTTPGPAILSSNLLSTGWFADAILISAFLNASSNGDQLRASFRHGVIISALVLTIFTLMVIMVFGSDMPANMVYPNLSLVQQINITDFMDRMDLIVTSVWFPIIACKIIVTFLALLTVISSFTGNRDYRFFNKPVALFLCVASIVSFKNITELFNFANYSLPIAIFLFQVPLMLVMYILTMIHIKKSAPDQARTSQAGSPGNANSPPSQGEQTSSRSNGSNQPPPSGSGDGISAEQRVPLGNMLDKMSFRRLSVLTVALAVCLIILVIVGITCHTRNSAVGIACALGYGACILLLLAVSYIEVMKARKLETKNGA
ncbi:GerAB/ArcD/ProY family transporter [Paenibacillus thalictri]|uniref:GerAB/ArcD/ProY family transporter n=1 Tax=Paenibacillus thalictri TaxID=2527873 RepID=UPI0013EF5355|nr:endospore germination permease [Paenibacillus thalictri]